MEGLETMDKRIIRVADLLEQVQSVDEMIELHKQKEGGEDDLMLVQYQFRRNKFLKELKKILKELNIKLDDLAA